MMQFTETLPPLFHQEISPNFTTTATNKNQIHRTRPWPCGGQLFPTTTASSTNSTATCEANSIEQLLAHCANAIQTNDATLAQQILWVLNNLVPHSDAHHDSNQRLASAFLRALASRAARIGTTFKLLHPNPSPMNSSNSVTHNHRFSVIELANFVDLTPWHRFGFTAANAAILDAIEGFAAVHIVDLSSTHCMQIPTLIDAIAIRCFEGQRQPPLVKLTVAAADDQNIPPVLDLSYEELGKKLVNFAKSKAVTMEFRAIHSTSSDGFSSLIEHLSTLNFVRPRNQEALVVNCHMVLHTIPDETLLPVSSPSNSPLSYREMFIKELRCLDPTIVILVDEDADFTSDSLVTRLRSAFSYLWIPYDTVDTFLARGSDQRQWYEADIGWRIENVIAHEGVQRVERLEPKSRWAQRMRNANFRGICFGEEGVSEVKSMLDEHAAGWGLKREDEDLVLTWKGHNVVFANAWVPT